MNHHKPPRNILNDPEPPQNITNHHEPPQMRDNNPIFQLKLNVLVNISQFSTDLHETFIVGLTFRDDRNELQPHVSTKTECFGQYLINSRRICMKPSRSRVTLFETIGMRGNNPMFRLKLNVLVKSVNSQMDLHETCTK